LTGVADRMQTPIAIKHIAAQAIGEEGDAACDVPTRPVGARAEGGSGAVGVDAAPAIEGVEVCLVVDSA
jgi:hypothetical protein